MHYYVNKMYHQCIPLKGGWEFLMSFPPIWKWNLRAVSLTPLFYISYFVFSAQPCCSFCLILFCFWPILLTFFSPLNLHFPIGCFCFFMVRIKMSILVGGMCSIYYSCHIMIYIWHWYWRLCIYTINIIIYSYTVFLICVCFCQIFFRIFVVWQW